MKEVDRAEGRKALEALQKDIDGFDRAVAEHLDEETERADLWTEIEVDAETLRSALACLKALLAESSRSGSAAALSAAGYCPPQSGERG